MTMWLETDRRDGCLSNIRLALIEDFPKVCQMAREFHQCTEYREIEFDEASCFILFNESIAQGMCFVSESGGLTGFILGMYFPCPLNRMKRMASELAWWVCPANRNSSAGVKLLKALEGSAIKNECISLTMICLETMTPDVIQSIYERMGYKKAERAFVRRF